MRKKPPLLLRGLDGCWLEAVTLKVENATLSSLLRFSDQLRGIKNLKLEMLYTKEFSQHSSEQGLQLRLAPDCTLKLQKALSQLRSLSITECLSSDAPDLLRIIATSCTQLTQLELSAPDFWHHDPNPGILSAVGQLSSSKAFPALQKLTMRHICHQTLEALVARPNQHPSAASSKVSRPPAAATALQLRSLVELQVPRLDGINEVHSLRQLPFLTALVVSELCPPREQHEPTSGPGDQAVLQPSDLPPRLQALRVTRLKLCSLDAWLPILMTVPQLQVEVMCANDDYQPFQESRLLASKGAATALMHGRRVAGVESGLSSYRSKGQGGVSPAVLQCWSWHHKPSESQLDSISKAYQPLLSQLPFIELSLRGQPELSMTALAECLGATTTKLRLGFLVGDHNYRPGSLSTVAGWLELLDALPRGRTVQLTFDNPGWGLSSNCTARFPVYREDCVRGRLQAEMEGVVTSAIRACEQKGRALELCGPKGWLTFEEYQGLLSRSHVIRVAEIFCDESR